MDKLHERIVHLSGEKRKLLEKLLREEGLPLPPAIEALQSTEEADVLERVLSTEESGAGEHERNEDLSRTNRCELQTKKEEVRRFYDTISTRLDSSLFGEHSVFLNYGYMAGPGSSHSVIELPKQILNHNSVQLILEVIGECNLTGRTVLDVGCGRGGAIQVVAEYFRPSQVVGIDLSAAAIRFCTRQHIYDQVTFQEADAEQLPFANDSFDVVMNIESSHNYPVLFTFYCEVFRVLKEEGDFLYADLLPVDVMEQARDSLQEIGFDVEVERVITANVLASCDEVSRQHLITFSVKEQEHLTMANFLALPGSKVYEEMRCGRSVYKIFRLKKPTSSVATPSQDG